MTTLVVGASGATGRLLVEQLLSRGEDVKAVVRDQEKLSGLAEEYDRLSVIQAAILDLNEAELRKHVADCRAVASCLGHNLSFQGLFGPPRRLVTDATRRLCEAIVANGSSRPTRFVLMNTAANSNRDLDESVSLLQKMVIGLFRLLLPPHADNEEAADYLRTVIGKDRLAIEWVAVRPDSLVDRDEVTTYSFHPSPIRSTIFDPGKTSRINVADFMARLITGDALWNDWKGRMPVLYNAEV